MLARSLATTIAIATMLLAGCHTLIPQGVLPSEMRDQSIKECDNVDDCYVQVYPYNQQMVPEYIGVYRGKKLDLWINNGVAEFQDPPVTMKSGEPPILDCSEKNKLIVKCKVSNQADPTKKYGYTIYVKDFPPYDPFVWPR